MTNADKNYGFQLTDNAVIAVRKHMDDNNLIEEQRMLRIGITTGCAGFAYFLDLEKNKKDNDCVMEFKGFKVLIDPKSIIFLSETELDYKKGLLNSGYVFENKRAKKLCGCGNSFSM